MAGQWNALYIVTAASNWYEANTSASGDWRTADLLAAKAATGQRVSVVIPAKDEEKTIEAVVGAIRADLMLRAGLVDELVVIDSLSIDQTAAAARSAGATVWSVADIRPDLGVRRGKGEALWKSLFVTSGDILVFVDADLTAWGTHFVTGLVGPLLTQPESLLVKGFYDRVLDAPSGAHNADGGRVTELVARPLIAHRWPELGRVVQPLAGEWSVRRRWFESLDIPMGYGVEFACLVDTFTAHGLPAIAQVDLGRRAHRHQSIHDLGAMSLEIIAAADARYPGGAKAADDVVALAQPDRRDAAAWRVREVSVAERGPARDAGAEMDGPTT